MNKKAVILPFLLALMASCGNKGDDKNKTAAQPFPVVTISPTSITGYSEFPTSIQGRNNNDVRAKISGYIEKVYVDEGQYVQQGQPLFKLETNIISQNANAAQAGTNASKERIDAAQAAVDAAQVEVNKLIPLVDKNIISNIQLETAKANLQQAKSQLGQAKAAYAQSRANYEGAIANVDYSVIRSPVSGIVGSLPLKVGSLVGPTDQMPITTVSDTKELFAYFSMNEAEYLDFLEKTPGENIQQKLKNSPQVDLLLANGSLYSEKGKIETITGQIDPSTGSMQFRASFPNKNGLLTNGSSGIIRIPKVYDNAIVIPTTATFEQQGILYVFKLDNKDTARSVVIKTKAKLDNAIVIDTGVANGEKIIADGVGNLKDGAAIKPQTVSLDSMIHSIKPIFE